MKLRMWMVAALFIIASEAGWAQPGIVLVCETNDALRCPCLGGPFIEDGTARLMWDWNSDGRDEADSVLAIFDWSPTEDYCITFSQDTIAMPWRFYVRIVSGECCFKSAIFVVTNGPWEIELDNWNCRVDGCYDLQPEDFRLCESSLNFSCPCGDGGWPPEGTPVSLYHDWNLNGPNPTDTLDCTMPTESGSGPMCLTFPAACLPDLTNPVCYASLTVESCCFFSDPFVLQPGMQEMTGWSCMGHPCLAILPPDAPYNVRASTCHEEMIEVRWEHSGENAMWFLIYRDEALILTVGVEAHSAMIPCTAEANEICVAALNPVGPSTQSCAISYPFLLRFSDGPGGDLAGVYGPDNEVTLEFEHPGPNPETIPTEASLVLLSDNLPVDTLCVDTSVAQMTCVLPGFAPAPLRMLLMARHLEFGYVEYDTTASEFYIGDAVTGWGTTLPIEFGISSVYPNPFNAQATIEYFLAAQSSVALRVFDVTGRLVSTPASGVFSPGVHRVSFGGANLAAGIYFVRLESEVKSVTKKLLLLK